MLKRMSLHGRASRGFTPLPHGFTLIELVVAMLIVAVLAAVAIPAYSNYVRQSRRTQAKSALLDMASLEERYFSTMNTYSTNPSDLGYGAGPLPLALSSYFQIQSISVVAAVAPTAGATPTAGTPATYTLTVQATGDQLKDTDCFSYTVTSSGTQTSLNSALADSSSICWKQ